MIKIINRQFQLISRTRPVFDDPLLFLRLLLEQIWNHGTPITLACESTVVPITARNIKTTLSNIKMNHTAVNALIPIKKLYRPNPMTSRIRTSPTKMIILKKIFANAHIYEKIMLYESFFSKLFLQLLS